MNLLTLLNELEPDAGWRRAPSGAGMTESVVTESLRCNAYPKRPTDRAATRVAIFGLDVRSPSWRKCESVAMDLKTALKMALTGYRAGETR